MIWESRCNSEVVVQGASGKCPRACLDSPLWVMPWEVPDVAIRTLERDMRGVGPSCQIQAWGCILFMRAARFGLLEVCSWYCLVAACPGKQSSRVRAWHQSAIR